MGVMWVVSLLKLFKTIKVSQEIRPFHPLLIAPLRFARRSINWRQSILEPLGGTGVAGRLEVMSIRD